jgi:hypothetical protein
MNSNAAERSLNYIACRVFTYSTRVAMAGSAVDRDLNGRARIRST